MLPSDLDPSTAYPEDPLRAAEQMQDATTRLRSGIVPVIADDGSADLVIDLR